MKSTLFLLFLLAFFSGIFAQDPQWTWLRGQDTYPGWAVYGNKGVAAATNKPAGRKEMANWMDASGNLWCFGGNGYGISSNYERAFNDMWKYAPSTGLWTWVGGDNVENVEGVYGTKGITSSLAKPGAREGALHWSDADGNMWMFGGYRGYQGTNGPVAEYYNDLWKYAPASGLWTWVSGDNTPNQTAVLGVKGVPAATNKPGVGAGPTWTDRSGNLWLFGGSGSPTLWKFDVSTGWWTYMNGYTGNTTPKYGVKGVPASDNTPGLRGSTVNWTDSSGNLWMFGGSASSSTDYSTAYVNELWKYTISTSMWTWVGGDNTPFAFQYGLYGAQGIAAPGNRPGSRSQYAKWRDNSGRFWLFGGYGYFSNGLGPTPLNDLWSTAPAPLALPLVFSSLHARKQQESVVIDWTTAQEQNSCCFIVERSAAGAVFDTIGMVRATGTTAASTAYSFTDKNPEHLLQTEERRGNKGKSMMRVAVHSLAKGTYLINVRSGNYSNTKIFIKQ